MTRTCGPSPYMEALGALIKRSCLTHSALTFRLEDSLLLAVLLGVPLRASSQATYQFLSSPHSTGRSLADFADFPRGREDGLVIPELGGWAREKYLRVWIYDQMFATGMKNAWDEMVYVDLFSGQVTLALTAPRRLSNAIVSWTDLVDLTTYAWLASVMWVPAVAAGTLAWNRWYLRPWRSIDVSAVVLAVLGICGAVIIRRV